MSQPASDKPRFTLTYAWNDDPYFAVQFTDLELARAHVHEVVQRPVRIFDAQTNEHGTLFPSGTLRWFS